MASFETLRWREGRLEMLDQRVLPSRTVYLPYDSAAAVAEGIRTMVVRGAPAIGCAAAYGIALEALRLKDRNAADFQAGLARAHQELAASRPTAVNLFWALARMREKEKALDGALPPATAAALLDEAQAIAEEDVRLNRAMGGHGAVLLADGGRVLTHCNAGALATAGHGTALGVIRSAVASGKRIEVLVDETRPFLQGARLTAWELAQDGIRATLIADNAAGHLMSRNEVDAVIVGADRVAANGDVANKIGTYGVAVLAQRHGIPFYVACPLSTIDLAVASGADIPIEERGAEEVTGYGGVRWAPEGIAARNPVFDVTPAALVTALITEKGVVRTPDREKLKKLFS
jgi:methylthioribose-1-phosphate isomerase